MLQEVTIENYKSIKRLKFELGRVNILIGANGSGKSNILEAIALASAASQDKLDNEFLTSRGIRVTSPNFMFSAFDNEQKPKDEIKISFTRAKREPISYEIISDQTTSYPKLRNKQKTLHDQFSYLDFIRKVELLRATISSHTKESKISGDDALAIEIEEKFGEQVNLLVEQIFLGTLSVIPDFLIYSPENSSLRLFEREGQILPIGINGEGLFAHLKALNTEKNKDELEEIISKLCLLDWFENFEIPDSLSPGERSIQIRDRYLREGALFDQRSTNEGFLFLLFYFTLFISPETPTFFAIDNIDASLNPKLCSALLLEIIELTKENEKQVIMTTHNPALLDGLNLHDDDQRLFIVSRNKDGFTKIRRVPPPQIATGQHPVKLSEAFLRGYIGGLPDNF